MTRYFSIIFAVLSVAAAPYTVYASDSDKTLSPYFLIKSELPEGLEGFPLQATEVKVHITGVIANVSVVQRYQNRGTVPIEAIYVFPASTRAAVHAMKMTIGERVRVAKIKERESAKRAYNKAKKEGKSASLLEQNRPNVFQMSIANIMPGDLVEVELKYTELLIPDDGVYDFIYPTVVGPRYSNQPASTAPSSEKWIANPYLRENEESPSQFSLNLTVNAGVPIADLSSPSHKIQANFESATRAALSIDSQQGPSNNSDFVLRYRLKGAAIQSGVLTFSDREENFFLMMLEPPERVAASSIPAREYIFILDISGSMYGFPLDVTKEMMRELLSGLRPQDRFNVLLFAGGSALYSPRSVPAAQAEIQKAIYFIEQQNGGGGTELLPALKRALALPQNEEISRTIVIATDGYVSVEREAFELVKSNLSNSNLFAFGIGSSVNRHLIEGLARAGRGEPFVILNQNEAPAVARKFRRYIETPVLNRIKVRGAGVEIYDLAPASIPDLFAERPITLIGKWRGSKSGTLELNASQNGQEFKASLPLADSSSSNEALRYLWARTKIAEISDLSSVSEVKEDREAIVQLGIQYNLLTKHTSFIAVDEVIRNKEASSKSVNQPLPLPKGVSENAVGAVPSVPEPGFYLLLAVMTLSFLLAARRKAPSVERS